MEIIQPEEQEEKGFLQNGQSSVTCWTISHGLINVHVTGTPER